MDPLLHLVAIGFILLVLARAVIEQALAFATHIANLRDYRLLPDQLVPIAAAALLAAEIAAMAGLVVPVAVPIGAVLATLLLVLYAAAMAAVLWSGRGEIECGCGGDGQLVSWALVARNGVLVVIAAGILLPETSRPLHWPDLLVGPVAVLVLYLLLAIAEQAIGTSAAIRRLNTRPYD
jgi:hypothetical protein